MTYLQEILLRWWYRILILKSIMGAACIRVYIRRLDRVLYQYSVHSGYIYIFYYYASFHRRGVKQPRRKTHSTLSVIYIPLFNKPIICCSISLCLCLSKCAVYVSHATWTRTRMGQIQYLGAFPVGGISGGRALTCFHLRTRLPVHKTCCVAKKSCLPWAITSYCRWLKQNFKHLNFN